jgi:hypothetical protein
VLRCQVSLCLCSVESVFVCVSLVWGKMVPCGDCLDQTKALSNIVEHIIVVSEPVSTNILCCFFEVT